MLIKINSKNPQKRLIKKIINTLNKGGLIVYPTDTIYGIGCNMMDKKAIEKIYKIKEREKNLPLSFICSGLNNISKYAKVSNFAYKTIKKLIPGPYTFILKASKLVPKIMLTKRKHTGIRVPNNKICMEIIKELGNPIVSTSATTRHKTLISNPSFINEYFGKNIDIVIDSGKVINKSSSIISLLDDKTKIIREGLGDTSMFIK